MEDDCVPDQSFFPYCEALLKRYRHDQRVGIVSGNNFLFEDCKMKESYYFSVFPHIWGSATWRRVWQKYDSQIEKWPSIRDEDFLSSRFSKRAELLFWQKKFDKVFANQIDTWDFHLVFSLWESHMFSIVPAVNLVKNIGFGKGASNARGG